MKTLRIILIMLSTILIYACGGGAEETTDDGGTQEEKAEKSHKGIGEVKHVDLTDPLDEQMTKVGKMIYDLKCSACHKLTDQRVVGPGWSGVTNRRSPEWILNMITNVDMMLEADPQAQALLEECLVRMPNQNVSVTDARGILEFMRKNDMETMGKKDEGRNI